MSETIHKSSVRQANIDIFIMLLCVVVIGYLTYDEMLGYFFTGVDTFTLIETNHVDSFQDVINIFSQPLMSNTQFLGLFYRPLANLTFSLDYYIWGLNPFGYHLTDLILQFLVSILVFYFILILTHGRKAASFLGAILFTTHPVLFETVPAISRRQDILPTLFMLTSLIFLIKYQSETQRQKLLYLGLSIFTCALALFSKELAILLPVMIYVFLLIDSINRVENLNIPFKTRIFRTLKIFSPYGLVTIIYLAVRTYVLGEFRGGGASRDNLATVSFIVVTTKSYFLNLIQPIPLFGEVGIPEYIIRAGYLILAFIFTVVLFLQKDVIIKYIRLNTKKPAERLMNRLFITITLFSITVFLFYPVISRITGNLTAQTYFGEPTLISSLMKNKDLYSLDHYLEMNADLILVFLQIPALLFMVTSLVIIRGLRSQNENKLIKDLFATTGPPFLIVCLALPLILFVGTNGYRYDYMYLPTVFFSAFLSLAIMENTTFLYSWLTPARNTYITRGSILQASIISIVSAGLAGSLLWVSPLVRQYSGWKEAGKMSFLFLQPLSNAMKEVPTNTSIHIYDLPRIYKPQSIYYVNEDSARVLNDYSIKSWLDLQIPDNHFLVEVIEEGLVTYYSSLDKIDLEITPEQTPNIAVRVKTIDRQLIK